MHVLSSALAEAEALEQRRRCCWCRCCCLWWCVCHGGGCVVSSRAARRFAFAVHVSGIRRVAARAEEVTVRHALQARARDMARAHASRTVAQQQQVLVGCRAAHLARRLHLVLVVLVLILIQHRKAIRCAVHTLLARLHGQPHARVVDGAERALAQRAARRDGGPGDDTVAAEGVRAAVERRRVGQLERAETDCAVRLGAGRSRAFSSGGNALLSAGRRRAFSGGNALLGAGRSRGLPCAAQRAQALNERRCRLCTRRDAGATSCQCAILTREALSAGAASSAPSGPAAGKNLEGWRMAARRCARVPASAASGERAF
jgi:hypothetical protein